MTQERFGERVEATAVSSAVLALVASDLARPVLDLPGDGRCCVAEVFRVFAEQRIPAWIVGGAPRDWLEGKHCYDLDLAHEVSFAAARRLVARAFPGGTFFEAYPHFGLFRWGSESAQVDFNILRAAHQVEPGLPLFGQRSRLGHCLSEDALLRDFTINALYFAPASGLFLDPTRRGLEALAHRRLDFAGPAFLAHTNPFLSLRAIKFIVKGYHPAPEVVRFLQTHLEDDVLAHGARLLRLWLDRQVPVGAMVAFAAAAKGFMTRATALNLLKEAVALRSASPGAEPVQRGAP